MYYTLLHFQHDKVQLKAPQICRKTGSPSGSAAISLEEMHTVLPILKFKESVVQPHEIQIPSFTQNVQQAEHSTHSNFN